MNKNNKEMETVTIIGAGPVGCYLGWLLAKQGMKVDIFEEHPEIGKPVQCSGIISRNLANIIDVDKRYVVNRVYGADIYSPDGSCLSIKKKEFQAYIVDRTRFDQHWAEMAEDSGCRIFMNKRLKSLSWNASTKSNACTALFEDSSKHTTDIVVGADGPLSQVAKSASLFGKSHRKYYMGIQCVVKSKTPSIAKDKVELYLGSTAPGFFAWRIPENEYSYRIALATDKNNARELFNSYLKKQSISYSASSKSITAGLIPVYSPKIKIQDKKKNVYLVGDAAHQVKATTGGGIIMGFLAAKELAKSITTGNDYESGCMNIRLNLLSTLLLRNCLNKMTDSDYNSLITIFKSGNAKDIVKRYGDMDYPLKFVFRLIIAEPRLLAFSKLLLR